jgi:hypothetical protein
MISKKKGSAKNGAQRAPPTLPQKRKKKREKRKKRNKKKTRKIKIERLKVLVDRHHSAQQNFMKRALLLTLPCRGGGSSGVMKKVKQNGALAFGAFGVVL